MSEPGFDHEPAIFTIAASNYLAQASVLGASIGEHHPGQRLVVFLLDALPEGVSLPDHLVIVPAERAFERREWNHRRAHYDILEFATSVKPACFRFLFDRGARRAIYLDPDIRVYQRLDLFWRGDESDDALVLTPHLLSPLPDDGLQPDDLAILRAGMYNLGFAALRDTPQARALLDWWDAKLHRHCLHDVREGVFTDQKWMDYAPLLVRNSAVLEHPGFNVAYWNLHERTPRHVGGRWQVESREGEHRDLIFFHFSGFTPGQQRISKHETRFGRRAPGDAPRLLEDYANALVQAGAEAFRAIEAPRAAFRDGTAWDAICRALYRQAVAEGRDLGDPLEDPGVLDWAMATAPGDHVPRYVRQLLRLRVDVAAAYDDGRDAGGLSSWMRGSGVAEAGLSPRLVERIAGAVARGAPSVNYVGYLRSHLGVGEAARQSIAALHAAGVAVRTHDISAAAAAPMGDYAVATAREMQVAPITLLGCNADVLPGVLAALPRPLADSYRIGCWYWETPEFPEAWTNRFDLVDEIWVATQFVADAIRAKATVPVLVMPPMVRPPRARRDRAWLARHLPEVTEEEFVFLFQFDAASVSFRKNPEGVIAAFTQAFSPHEPVRLVLKLLNGHAEPGLVDRLRSAAAGQRISVFDEALGSGDNLRLVASADSFVSLHRAEGFGLSIAEAMAHGLPVVATGWSGNADFTTADNAALVPYDLVAATRAHGPYPAGTLWAEPRLDAAAHLMRRVWTDKAWRAAIGRAGAETVARLYGEAAVGGAMRERLLRIERSARLHLRRQGGAAAPSSHARGAPAPLPTRSSAARLATDMLRFPGYYMARLPRVPAIVWRMGITDTLTLAQGVAAGPNEIKQQYRIGALLNSLMARWRRWRHARRLRHDPPGLR
ncbi:MAG: glycosyltransferase family 4 protein [Variovorax sp.]|nr:glycosyltransferase family 4 protein [Variovorax sp.]